MTDAEKKNWWQTFHKFQKSREKTWAPVINKALKNQYKSVADYLKENGIQSTINKLDFIVKFDELAKIIQNIYIDAGTVFGGKAYQLVKKQGKERKAMMPIGYNDELVQEIIRYFKLSLLNEAVMPITEKTKSNILKVLTDAQLNGVSINDIVDKLTDTDLSRERSRAIARTETVKSSNYAAVQAVKKLGYDTMKIWISATDIRTRRQPRDEADHLHANGQTVPMDEPFKIRDRNNPGNFVDMMQPGDPKGGAENVVNCRCTVGFEIID